jgi:hypothetical protein
MSGYQEAQDDDSIGLTPQAPPPAVPPPPPPAYGTVPTIHHYEDYVEPSPATRQGKRGITISTGSLQDPITPLHSGRGDASLRPNIGETNAALGEESLRESLHKLRLLNIIACSLALLLEIPNLLGNVFTLQPARAVLGIYLSFFALLLCGYELDMVLTEKIELYFGLLYHPVGRSFVLMLMGGLAIGQNGILDLLLGLVFIWSSLYTLTTFCWYPEYRRRTEQRRDLYEEANEAVAVQTWAHPDKVGEAVSLLQKATRPT